MDKMELKSIYSLRFVPFVNVLLGFCMLLYWTVVVDAERVEYQTQHATSKSGKCARDQIYIDDPARPGCYSKGFLCTAAYCRMGQTLDPQNFHLNVFNFVKIQDKLLGF